MTARARESFGSPRARARARATPGADARRDARDARRASGERDDETAKRIGETKRLIGLCYTTTRDAMIAMILTHLRPFESRDFFLAALAASFSMARRCARGSLAYSASAALRLLSASSSSGVGTGGVEDAIQS